MSKKAIYAGTFDPFTNGHLDIVNRALTVFDEVVILIAVSPTKKPLFSVDERVKMISDLFENNSSVSVDKWDGLIVEYARKVGIKSLVRGLRPTGDFENEFQMASMNKKLYEEIETLFLMTGPENYFVSSSLVREIQKHGKDISEFIPKEIYKYIKK